MSKMNSKFKYMFDAAPGITLLAKDGVAKTVSFDGTAMILDEVEGYWNAGYKADQTFALVVNVTDVAASARTATMTFASVVATDTFTLSDGVDSVVFTCLANGADSEGEFNVGGSDTLTAAAARDAINAAYEDGSIAISATSALGVITLTNHLGTGGTITEAETTITTTAFAGNNETYKLDVQGGPVGFGSNVVLHSVPVTKKGQYVLPLDLDTAKALKADLAAIRLVGTLAGVSPSITAHSWIAGIQK